MDDAAKDELRVLRNRAYGPNADIQSDPVALDRLRQLEDDGLRSAVVDAVDDDTSGEQQVDGPTADPAPEADDTGTDDAEPAAERDPAPAASGRWSGRGLAWAWIGTLVVAIALGAGLTALSESVFSRSGDARQVGTMTAVSDFTWPEFLGTATSDARGYTDFLGLTAITTDQQWTGPGTDSCLLILAAADVSSATSEGPIRYDCGTTAFPPSVQFTVTAQMPDELIERFPIGTHLQFVVADAQPASLGAVQIEVFTVEPDSDSALPSPTD